VKTSPSPVAPSDILSNLFLEDLEKIWELKTWIPDPCNPYLHDLKQVSEEEERHPVATGFFPLGYN